MNGTLPPDRQRVVLDTLATAIANAINQAAPDVAADVFVGRASPTELRDALAVGSCQVEVYPLTTRAMDADDPISTRAITSTPTIAVAATMSGTQIELTGPAACAGNIVVVEAAPGAPSVGAPIASGDSASTIATKLAAALVAAGIAAQASGALVTMPSASARTSARIGAQGFVYREIGRYATTVQVTVYAPSDDVRCAVAGAIRRALASKTQPRLAIGDGTAVRVRFGGDTATDDSLADLSLYLRRLMYSLEYAELDFVAAAQVVGFAATIQTPGMAPAATYGG